MAKPVLPSEQLSAIAEQARAAVNAETAVIALLEAAGEVLFYAAAVGKHAGAIAGKRSATQTSGLCGAVCASGEAELVDQTDGDLRIRQDLAQALGITTALALPMEKDNQLLGVLMLLNRSDSTPFDDAARHQVSAYLSEVMQTLSVT